MNDKHKGFASIIVLLIIILFGIGGLLILQSRDPNQVNQPQIQTPSTAEQPSAEVDTSSWKTYISPNNEFSFKYPENWYFEKLPDIEELSAGFFVNGTVADHSYGDHTGNEVFNINLGEAAYPYDYVRKNFYPKATDFTVAGKPAFRQESIVKIFIGPQESRILHLGTKSKHSQRLDQILSTFKFLE